MSLYELIDCTRDYVYNIVPVDDCRIEVVQSHGYNYFIARNVYKTELKLLMGFNKLPLDYESLSLEEQLNVIELLHEERE